MSTKAIYAQNIAQSTKAAPKTDGLGRIRTGDLRHVKTEDFALRAAFSSFSSLLFLAALADETTTRKASAPS